MGNNETPLVQMEGVTKRFGEITAVSGITLDLPRGAILIFIGPSGCGETTTVRLMVGNYKPSEGEVQVFGRAPDCLKSERVRQNRV